MGAHRASAEGLKDWEASEGEGEPAGAGGARSGGERAVQPGSYEPWACIAAPAGSGLIAA